MIIRILTSLLTFDRVRIVRNNAKRNVLQLDNYSKWTESIFQVRLSFTLLRRNGPLHLEGMDRSEDEQQEGVEFCEDVQIMNPLLGNKMPSR